MLSGAIHFNGSSATRFDLLKCIKRWNKKRQKNQPVIIAVICFTSQPKIRHLDFHLSIEHTVSGRQISMNEIFRCFYQFLIFFSIFYQYLNRPCPQQLPFQIEPNQQRRPSLMGSVSKCANHHVNNMAIVRKVIDLEPLLRQSIVVRRDDRNLNQVLEQFFSRQLSSLT